MLVEVEVVQHIMILLVQVAQVEVVLGVLVL
jgi:hypothetical protein